MKKMSEIMLDAAKISVPKKKVNKKNKFWKGFVNQLNNEKDASKVRKMVKSLRKRVNLLNSMQV